VTDLRRETPTPATKALVSRDTPRIRAINAIVAPNRPVVGGQLCDAKYAA
jgi:hypothetical protein